MKREQVMKITKHAQERIQQRGFQESFIDLILMYGIPRSKQGGVTEYIIPKKQKAQILGELKDLMRKIEKSSNKAVLLDESSNTIVTAYNIN